MHITHIIRDKATGRPLSRVVVEIHVGPLEEPRYRPHEAHLIVRSVIRARAAAISSPQGFWDGSASQLIAPEGLSPDLVARISANVTNVEAGRAVAKLELCGYPITRRTVRGKTHIRFTPAILDAIPEPKVSEPPAPLPEIVVDTEVTQ